MTSVVYDALMWNELCYTMNRGEKEKKIVDDISTGIWCFWRGKKVTHFVFFNIYIFITKRRIKREEYIIGQKGYDMLDIASISRYNNESWQLPIRGLCKKY